MKKKRSEYLMKRLIKNQISRKDLETLLDSLEDENSRHFFTTLLEVHYNQILNEYLTHLNDKTN